MPVGVPGPAQALTPPRPRLRPVSGEKPRKIALRDGATVLIRPIRPTDKDGLAAGFERLSPASRYRRFFTASAHLGESDLDYLVNVDHHDHEALLAIDPVTRDGVGVARYVRTGADTAEPAVVVADDWQGRGVGGALVRRLVQRARAEGIRRFEAPVLAGNVEALELFEHVGPATRRDDEGEVVVVLVDLPDDRPHREWRRLLPHFAAGTLEPRALLARLQRERSTKPEDR
jgi:GNAT superfamily N-acetyltransferase